MTKILNTLYQQIKYDYDMFIDLLGLKQSSLSLCNELELVHRKMYLLRELVLLKTDYLSVESLLYFNETIADLAEGIMILSKGRIKTSKMLLRSSLETFMKSICYSLNISVNSNFSSNIEFIRKNVVNIQYGYRGKKQRDIQNYFIEKLENVFKQEFYWPICNYVHSNNSSLLSTEKFLIDILNLTINKSTFIEHAKVFDKVLEYLILLLLLSSRKFYIGLDSEKVSLSIKNLSEFNQAVLFYEG
ncbi:hypothetical protein [Paenibacillus durus]|uniref:Uncharacterized protein n=1 Tax=Paenibacillus durus TaxID=44251 RepID=A0A089IQN8_PAEDU|nr:hypothetical protein [Paenibacillus durus]AIQ11349.1 hypothetical protein PDUR_04605 [Paenibacillus durus]